MSGCLADGFQIEILQNNCFFKGIECEKGTLSFNVLKLAAIAWHLRVLLKIFFFGVRGAAVWRLRPVVDGAGESRCDAAFCIERLFLLQLRREKM